MIKSGDRFRVSSETLEQLEKIMDEEYGKLLKNIEDGTASAYISDEEALVLDDSEVLGEKEVQQGDTETQEDN